MHLNWHKLAHHILIAAILIPTLSITTPTQAQQPCTLEQRFYYLGTAVEKVKDVEAALAYNHSVELDRNTARFYVDRAQLLFAAVEFDELAIADYDTALQLEPQNPTIYFQRANTLFFSSRYSEAITDYLTAISIFPPTDANLSLANIMLAQAYIANQQYTEADALLNQLAITGGQSALTNAVLGILQSTLGYAEIAEAYWSLVEDLDPAAAQFFIEQAFNFHERRDFEASIAHATLALRFSNRNPNARLVAYFLRASSQLKRQQDVFTHSDPLDDQQIELSAADATQAIAIDANCAPLYNLRGMAYTSLDNNDLALPDLNTATILDPGFYPTYQSRGLINRDLGQNPLADADLDFWGNAFSVDLAAYWALCGNLFFELGDDRGAMASYMVALLIMPNNLEAVLGAGDVLRAIGRFEDEHQLYTDYIDQFGAPADSEIRRRLDELEQLLTENAALYGVTF